MPPPEPRQSPLDIAAPEPPQDGPDVAKRLAQIDGGGVARGLKRAQQHDRHEHRPVGLSPQPRTLAPLAGWKWEHIDLAVVKSPIGAARTELFRHVVKTP